MCEACLITDHKSLGLYRITGRQGDWKKVILWIIIEAPLQREVYQRLVYHGETSEMKYCENSHKNICAVLLMEVSE